MFQFVNISSSLHHQLLLPDIMDSIIPLHPYYPLGLELAGYVANEWSVPVLVIGFLGGWGVMLGLTLLVVNHFQPSLSKTDKALILWFVLSKFLTPDFSHAED